MVRLILHKTFIEPAILCLVLFNRTTMTSLLLLFAMLYAACGLVLSIVVNAVSFTSIQLGGNALFPVLMWGIFPAFLSVILHRHFGKGSEDAEQCG